MEEWLFPIPTPVLCHAIFRALQWTGCISPPHGCWAWPCNLLCQWNVSRCDEVDTKNVLAWFCLASGAPDCQKRACPRYLLLPPPPPGLQNGTRGTGLNPAQILAPRVALSLHSTNNPPDPGARKINAVVSHCVLGWFVTQQNKTWLILFLPTVISQSCPFHSPPQTLPPRWLLARLKTQILYPWWIYNIFS